MVEKVVLESEVSAGTASLVATRQANFHPNPSWYERVMARRVEGVHNNRGLPST